MFAHTHWAWGGHRGVASLNPGSGSNLWKKTARASNLVISALPVHSTSFSPKSISPNKDGTNVWNCEKTWLVIRWIVFRPDISATVDRSLKTNYLPTYLPPNPSSVLSLFLPLNVALPIPHQPIPSETWIKVSQSLKFQRMVSYLCVYVYYRNAWCKWPKAAGGAVWLPSRISRRFWRTVKQTSTATWAVTLIYLFYFILQTLLSISGKLGRLTWVRLQQLQEQRHRSPTSACWVFLCFHYLFIFIHFMPPRPETGGF